MIVIFFLIILGSLVFLCHMAYCRRNEWHFEAFEATVKKIFAFQDWLRLKAAN